MLYADVLLLELVDNDAVILLLKIFKMLATVKTPSSFFQNILQYHVIFLCIILKTPSRFWEAIFSLLFEN